MTKTAKCSVCHEACDTWLMREIQTGRRVQLICPACWRKGQSQVSAVFTRPGRSCVKVRIKEDER